MDSGNVKRGVALAGLATTLVAGGVWLGGGLRDDAIAAPANVAAPKSTPSPRATARGDVESVEPNQAVDSGLTPMAQRVAVLGVLNKRNGVSRDITMRPGQARRVGDTVVRLRACEQTAPWEPERLTGAFVQVDVEGVDDQGRRGWRRPFSGWLFKERPALNVVPHPVYDVWVKSCTMAFPATGPDTQSLSAPRAASKAPKSADAETSPAEPPEPSTPSAASSNAI